MPAQLGSKGWLRQMGSRLLAAGVERFFRQARVPAEVHDFLERHRNVYLSAGGIGDAWLTVAMLSQEDQPRLLFGANPGTERMVGRIFELFDIPTLIVGSFANSPAGLATFDYASEHPHCVSKLHLPPHLDYEDWARRTDWYVSRLVRRLGVREQFGRSNNIRATARMVALAPRGSQTCRPFERKWLAPEEYHRMVAGLLERNCTVVSVGSESDLLWYGLHPHPNHVWQSGDWRMSYPECREPGTLEALLAVVNGCDEVISVDTWLKTYAALAGVHTTVIATRYDRPYENPGDHLFLNPVWGFRIVNAEEFESMTDRRGQIAYSSEESSSGTNNRTRRGLA